MTRLEASIPIAAPAEQAFDVLLDIRQIEGYPAWHPALARGLRVTRLTEGVGTLYEHPLETRGAVARNEVVAYEPPRLVVVRMEGGVFTQLTHTWSLAPRDGGCTFNHVMEYRVRYQPFGALVDFFVVRPRLVRLMREGAEASRRRAEAHARA